jgi:hypothetical protein
MLESRKAEDMVGGWCFLVSMLRKDNGPSHEQRDLQLVDSVSRLRWQIRKRLHWQAEIGFFSSAQYLDTRRPGFRTIKSTSIDVIRVGGTVNPAS